MEQEGVFFVTRAKHNMNFEMIETNYNIDDRTGLISYQNVILKSVKSTKLHPKPIRMVVYRTVNKNITLVFITNNFEISDRDKMPIAEFITEIQSNQNVNKQLTLFE